nr:hypothetical protein [Brevundimonas sp.]
MRGASGRQAGSLCRIGEPVTEAARGVGLAVLGRDEDQLSARIGGYRSAQTWVDRDFERLTRLFLPDYHMAVQDVLRPHLAHIPRSLGRVKQQIESEPLSRSQRPLGFERADFRLGPGVMAVRLVLDRTNADCRVRLEHVSLDGETHQGAEHLQEGIGGGGSIRAVIDPFAHVGAGDLRDRQGASRFAEPLDDVAIGLLRDGRQALEIGRRIVGDDHGGEASRCSALRSDLDLLGGVGSAIPRPPRLCAELFASLALRKAGATKAPSENAVPVPIGRNVGGFLHAT